MNLYLYFHQSFDNFLYWFNSFNWLFWSFVSQLAKMYKTYTINPEYKI